MACELDTEIECAPQCASAIDGLGRNVGTFTEVVVRVRPWITERAQTRGSRENIMRGEQPGTEQSAWSNDFTHPVSFRSKISGAMYGSVPTNVVN